MNFNRETQGLKTITVSKDELISKITVNLDKHQEEYNQSIIDRKAYAIEVLTEQLAESKDGNVPEILTFDKVPNHSSEYETVIEMLTMSVDEEIEITYEQFKRYVRDEWEWKTEFLTVSGMYK